MSGFTGFWNLDGRPIDRGVLSRMSGTLRHRGLDGEQLCAAGPFGLAHQRSWVTPEEAGEVQPLAGPGGVLVAMDGRLDNRDELLGATASPASASDAALVLAAYLAWGDRFAARLNGDFAVVVFDQSKRQLLLARDAIGLRPLYYFRSDPLFAFGTEIKALLAHPDIPAQPDDEGIADYMLVSSRPLNRQEITCFAGISSLVPAHLAITTPEATRTRRYWDFDAGRTIRLGSFDEYADAFRERFAEAVRRRLRSAYPVAISVSGGLDSSSIFCQAMKLRESGAADCPGLHGISFFDPGQSEADERRYLVDIERACGVAIEQFSVAELEGPARRAHEQIAVTEAPLFDSLWGITRELGRRAAARGARVLVGGHWGDQVLISTDYLVDLFHRLAWREIRRHRREYVRWLGAGEARVLSRRFLLQLAGHHLPAGLVPPLKWVRRRVLGVERPKPWFTDVFLRRGLRFANAPAILGDGFHSAHAASIYREARSKYHVHCLEWHNKIDARGGLDAAMPMLDRDLLAFLMAIPGEIQTWSGVPRGLLREAMRGILPEAVRTRASKGDVTHLLNRWVAGDAPTIRGALSAESQSVRRGYVDRFRSASALDRLVADLQGPDALSSWDLGDVFGLEVWLQVFCTSAPRQDSRG